MKKSVRSILAVTLALIMLIGAAPLTVFAAASGRTVSFDPGRGGTGEMESVTVTNGGTYKLPENTFTAPDGWTFLGWQVGAFTGLRPVGYEITVTEDTVITARWKRDIDWVVKYEENFDKAVDHDQGEWVRDDFTLESDIYWGDNGYGTIARANQGRMSAETFYEQLNAIEAWRKSYTLGTDGWLTVNTYGVGENGEPPKDGAKFVINGDGKAVLVVPKHNDAVVMASTNPLPDTYRIEVTISDIDFGGLNWDEEAGQELKMDGTWTPWTSDWQSDYTKKYIDYEGDRINGYFADSVAGAGNAGPWLGGAEAATQNGFYFLSIVDYGTPMPHNNTFIHHHRKVAMDTDNNGLNPWSNVHQADGSNPADGSKYVSMLWMYDRDQSLNSGNTFYAHSSFGNMSGSNMVDKYIPGESYTFAVERTPTDYTLEVTGKFQVGGETTYRWTKANLPDATTGDPMDDHYTFHFNQTLEELQNALPDWANDTYSDGFQYFENTQMGPDGDFPHTYWSETEGYPDYFYMGVPHINWYAGTAVYSSLKLLVPADDVDDPAIYGVETYSYISQETGATGIVERSVKQAHAGETVTLTPVAGTMYRPTGVTVTTGDGKDVAVTDNGDGTYSFTMPASKVITTGKFAHISDYYEDVGASSWYLDAVGYAVAKDLMKGTGEHMFSPADTIDRAQVMTILARRAGVDTDSGDPDPWYAKGLAWAVEQGISDGAEPETLITREQLVTLLYRLEGRPEADLSVLENYSDASDIHDWEDFPAAMAWAVQSGILQGDGTGRLIPLRNATRAEAAQLLMMYCRDIHK